ncbi:MAG: cupredoxin domain-containing protein [Actinomycetota bacterium]|nr:cupredoxin domain-containing protein [Actinomycetota bacterium]
MDLKGETVPTLVGERTRKVMAGLFGLVMLLGLTGCGGGSSTDSGKRADVTVDSTDRFAPDKLEISLNQADSFTFLNKDKKVHNVTIPDFAIDMDIQPGQRIEVKIPTISTVPRDGFISFYCKYHQTEGESGRINISK